MNDIEIQLIKLCQETDIKPFKCINADLNGFLFEDAKPYLKSLMAVTYLLEDITNDVTIAYYSLLADKISFDEKEKSMWNKINRAIPNKKRRKDYPAVKIGRLAVNQQYANCGYGRLIVDNIIRKFSETMVIGCRFITVDALQSAIPFYQKCGFDFFTEKDSDHPTRLMFYDLKNVK
jgi:predicted GNAT family N-acyltransferase